MPPSTHPNHRKRSIDENGSTAEVSAVLTAGSQVMTKKKTSIPKRLLHSLQPLPPPEGQADDAFDHDFARYVGQVLHCDPDTLEPIEPDDDPYINRDNIADEDEEKMTAKRKRSDPSMVYVQPNRKLALVVGSKPLSRWELTKKLWRYIQKHGLQDKKVKTQINADTALQAVFDGRKQVSMFEMTKWVAAAIIYPGMTGETGAALPEELDSTEAIYEGAVKQITVNAYERSAVARKKCLLHHGCKCACCEAVLTEVYGEIAVGFIHVHHLKSLAEIGAKYHIDPIKDLQPVCPTCHAIIHLRKPALSIGEVKAFIKKQRKRRPALGRELV